MRIPPPGRCGGKARRRRWLRRARRVRIYPSLAALFAGEDVIVGAGLVRVPMFVGEGAGLVKFAEPASIHWPVGG